MTIRLVLSSSLGVALNGVVALQASFVANVERELAAALSLLADLQAELPDLQANLDVALNLSAQLKASLSIDPSLTIAASLAFAADAQAALAAGLSGPSLSVGLSAQLDAQLKATADLTAKVGLKIDAIAEVSARIGLLQAALSFAKSFDAQLSAGGVRLYVYNGPLGALGAELDAFLATPDGSAGLNVDGTVYVPILITDNAASFAAMGAFIRVS